MREPVRVAVLDDHLGVALEVADWSPLSGAADVAEVRVLRAALEPDELIAAVGDCEVVVAMRERTAFPRSVLEQLPRLRLLVTTGMVNAAIDLAAARELGVTVCGTGAGRPRGPDTPELAWTLVLDLVRGVTAADRAMRGGAWQTGRLGRRVAGLTVGLVGLGRVGGEVAAYARAFGCDVLAWSPHLSSARAAEHVAEHVELDELFERSDVVSLHLVLAETTRGLVGLDRLRRLGPDGFLVNTARGPLVVEHDLVRALREGWIAGAAIDTYDVEPLPADHPLRREPRALLTPHLGYVTAETFAVFYADAVEGVRAWLDGAPVRELT